MAWRTGILLASALCCRSVLADRGKIPFRPDVRLFEPKQRAMIAWNGEEEILLLSTDLSASHPTKVLELIPLPAEPAVMKGDVEAFRKALELINAKQSRGRGRKKAKARQGADGLEPAGEVTFHEKIGSHDISVTKVNDGKEFVAWVNDTLRDQGVENPIIPPALESVVQEYLADDFRWFVFDVIELGKTTSTQEAVQYRFKSDAVYYPLRVTRAEEGRTLVELLILTPRLLQEFAGIPIWMIDLDDEAVTLTSDELRSLNVDMADLLGNKPRMRLRLWRIAGRLSGFTRDLIAR